MSQLLGSYKDEINGGRISLTMPSYGGSIVDEPNGEFREVGGDMGELRTLMRKRFISPRYHSDLYNKLQNLQQGSKNVEDYYKEIEMAMIRANIEDRKAIMAMFKSELNPDIAHSLELQAYV